MLFPGLTGNVVPAMVAHVIDRIKTIAGIDNNPNKKLV